MKILVTGSRGFLGSNLVKRLRKDGHEVYGWDVADGINVCSPHVMQDYSFDAIFHLACPVNPADYKSVALKTIHASVVGTENMLQLALKNKAKFLYVSSSEIYGEVYKRPFKEDDLVVLDPKGERTFYDSSKLMGEVLTLIYHRYHGVDVRIIRPFNIYGPGMRYDDNRVIPSFIRKAKEKKKVQVAGDGTATRSFCYVDDFIEGMVRAMFYPNTNGEVFNLGTTDAISMIELAKMFPTDIDHIPARAFEQKDRKPNITKAEKILKWKPTTSLKEGLELMWKSYP